jgi:hypothetical protein
MSDTQAERPRFYQGQYIGPEDLSAVVDYARWSRARHDLGAHAWGIAVGLELRAIPSLAGGVEVYVEPGYAVDGFGRPLIVSTAMPVPVDALGRLNLQLLAGETSAAVPVWLRYVESTTSQPPYGFAGCEGDDAFARVAESCEVLVGARALRDRRDPVDIGGTSTDPVEALRTIETTAPLLCDASVPFQAFPSGDMAWWLIPLGYVRWQPGAPGSLLETTEADRREARRFRRYLGVVTEGVYAAGGLIRLRPRASLPASGAVSTEEACNDEWPRAQNAIDLTYDATSGRVTPTELVWIEGNLRLAGDARLFGGEVELRDEHGETRGVPMRVRRLETNSFRDAGGTAVSGHDLEIRIGTTGEDGRNRLVIGANPADPADVGGRVVVQNDGRVGIGTLKPPTPLLSPLTIRAVGGGEELLSFEAPTGARRWHVSQKPAGANGLGFAETGVKDGRLFLAAGGKVGMSTTTPEAKLEVAELSATAGALWLRVGDGGDQGRFWVEYSVDLAPLLVLSDDDDPPRIRFQQLGTSTDERAPQHASWIGHARSNSPDLAVMNGRLGVGTTEPQAMLHVTGGSDVALATAASGFLMLGTASGLNVVMDDNEIMARDGGALATLHLQAEGGDLMVHGGVADTRRVAVTDAGRLGVGTSAPTERLDVRGNVKLGAAGELFAIGALENLRVVTGQVGTGGLRERGVGFTCNRTDVGAYQVTFDTPFATPPVVLTSTVEAIADDNVVTLHNVTIGSFRAITMDVQPGPDPQDTAFTFIALGLRA